MTKTRISVYVSLEEQAAIAEVAQALGYKSVSECAIDLFREQAAKKNISFPPSNRQWGGTRKGTGRPKTGE